jgi:hypothetical protein
MLFAKSLEQAGVAEKFEMARHTRLTLADDARDLANREFTFGANGKQT